MAKKKLTKKQQREINKTIKAHWKFFLVLFLIVVTLGVVAYCMGWLDILFKKDEEPPVLSTAGGHVTVVDEIGDLEVNFLNVGQADCIIIELPDNKTMMIDTGINKSSQTVISNFLTANSIEYIDYMLITHSDEDHVDNADWVLNNYSVRYIFRPNIYSTHASVADIPSDFNRKVEGGYECSTKCYAEFIISAYNEGCTTEYFNKDSDFTNKVKCGSIEKSYTFNFLTPTAKREDVVYDNPNEYSPIMILEYEGRRIMLGGDAEIDTIEEYCEAYGSQYNVDVWKAGHHGSSNAISEEYLNAIDPEYVVIQCELGNKHDHPHPETMQLLKDYHEDIIVYRNDTNGTITFQVSSTGEMSWSMENTDTTHNYKSGVELASIMLSMKKAENSEVYLQEVISCCIMNMYEKRRYTVA